MKYLNKAIRQKHWDSSFFIPRKHIGNNSYEGEGFDSEGNLVSKSMKYTISFEYSWTLVKDNKSHLPDYL